MAESSIARVPPPLRMSHTFPAMTRAIPLTDLMFLWADRKEAPANVGVVLIFEPAEGRSADKAVREVLRAYRATPPTEPFNQLADAPPLGLAHWRDPDAIDMRRHVLRSTLPAPGTIAQLNERLAELHQGMLDRRHPLFEIHLIDGLESGRFALYVKSHHVSWDGRSAMARIFGSFSREPGPILAGFHAAPAAVDDGGTVDTGLAHNLRTLVSQAMAMRELYANVAKRIGALRGDTDRPRGNTPFAGPHTRFNRPVTAERTLGQFTLPLAALRGVGRAHGGTINDVLLAIVDDGVHRYLRDLGEPPPAPLVAMCPVSLRQPDDREAGTKATTLFVKLGSPRSGAGARLREIVASTTRAKAEQRSMSNEASLDFALLAFGLWLTSHAFGLDAYTKPVVNYVVSNVGGTIGENYLGRSRLVGAFPISMIADPAGLNFTTLSHDGRMDVGIIANRAALPDAEPLVAHCLAAWRRLSRAKPPQDLSLRKPPARKRSRTRRMPPSQRP
jgi:diacylglycerol O-acyltransferase / wax synthase